MAEKTELVPGENEFAFGPGGEQLRARFTMEPRGPRGFNMIANYHGDRAEVRLSAYQASRLRDVLTVALELVDDGGVGLVSPLFAQKGDK